MTINSRFWGVGWIEQTLPSIPGRTSRLKAIYLLQIAAEVEHALMAQYLCAVYSLDEAFGQADESPGTGIVDRWKRDIRLIARQEMAHFVTVQNLLLSPGAEVYVNRENNFSDHPDAYPFPVMFERFRLPSLARYGATELAASELQTKVKRVGVLYAALYWLFLRSDASQGPWPMPRSMRRCVKQAGLKGVHVKDTDFVPPSEYEDFAARSGEWEVFEDSMHVDDADPRTRALKAHD